MDMFVEQLVKKKKSTGQIVAIAGTILLALLLLAISILLIGVVGPLSAIIIVAVFYGAWHALLRGYKRYPPAKSTFCQC